MSTAEQIAFVVHTLGFGKRQLAEIFGVSRQAIYAWLRAAMFATRMQTDSKSSRGSS